ncbi:MAG: stage V sporulation protein T [Christensenellales bacterium]
MKATGIVRRIDELGRVVIPKEIRRTLRIREGDPLEIFTDRDGEVILKKYSPIVELSDFSREYTGSLYRSLGHVACICDKDTVIAVSGAGKKEFLDKRITPQLEQIITKRQKLVASRDQGKFIPITNDEEENTRYHNQTIVPILCEGDAIGAVILLGRDPAYHMGDTELKVTETAASFVGRQMES